MANSYYGPKEVVKDIFTLARKLNLEVRSQGEDGPAVTYCMEFPCANIELEATIGYNIDLTHTQFSVNPESLKLTLPPDEYSLVLKLYDEYLSFRQVNKSLLETIESDLRNTISDNPDTSLNKIRERLKEYIREYAPR